VIETAHDVVPEAADGNDSLGGLLAPGVYIHIPFCRTKCTYCAFVSGDFDESLAARYLPALEREIVEAGARDGHPSIDSVFFGGGTPSLIPEQDLVRVLDAVRSAFDVSTDAEITVEMNPGTLTPAKLDAYRRAGINRASVGVQSFDDAELLSIGRVHTADDAGRAVEMLRHAGFENVSLDLIAGLPNQSRDVWRRNLDCAIALLPDHLSLYLLELHPGTRLARDVDAGRIARPDDDLAAEMYFEMVDVLDTNGFVHYEISNFAASRHGADCRSRHNEKYWLDAPYYGFGVSAHAYTRGERRSNSRNIAAYADAIEQTGSAVVEHHVLELRERAGEAAFLGLRRLEGIDLAAFSVRYGLELLTAFSDGLERVLEAGLLVCEGGRLRLTRRGLVLSNEVFQAFL
jgi:oxygen-independent coproporphyrinogen-3 oxidase